MRHFCCIFVQKAKETRIAKHRTITATVAVATAAAHRCSQGAARKRRVPRAMRAHAGSSLGSVFERSFFTVRLCWGDFNLGQRRIKVFCITLPRKLRSFLSTTAPMELKPPLLLLLLRRTFHLVLTIRILRSCLPH